jgi:hypothetical protein
VEWFGWAGLTQAENLPIDKKKARPRKQAWLSVHILSYKLSAAIVSELITPPP